MGRPLAGTARSRPQSRMAAIFSGAVAESGTTFSKALRRFSALRLNAGFAMAR